MHPLAEQRQTQRLLQRIRTRVADLRRLEQADADQSEVQQQRREISRLQWQLARFVSRHPGDGSLAA